MTMGSDLYTPLSDDFVYPTNKAIGATSRTDSGEHPLSSLPTLSTPLTLRSSRSQLHLPLWELAGSALQNFFCTRSRRTKRMGIMVRFTCFTFTFISLPVEVDISFCSNSSPPPSFLVLTLCLITFT